MSKFHLTPTGQARVCSAQSPESCKYSQLAGETVEHYSTKEEAQRAYEQQQDNAGHSVGKITKTDVKKSDKAVVDVPGTDGVQLDLYNSSPAVFDKTLNSIMWEHAKANFEKDRREKNILSIYNIKETKDLDRATIDKTVADFLNRDNLSNYHENIRESYVNARDDEKKLRENIMSMNKAYDDRGSWNRAFLVTNGNGHVHSSMNCSTCNRNGAQTSFQLMSDYSNNTEDQIVHAAGYRACTTCYPSAPVGNEDSLPTQMFSATETATAETRAKREKEKQEKAAQAVSKAPTASGEPLTIVLNGRSETLKTEQAAFSEYVDSLLYAKHTPNEKMAEDLHKSELIILSHLAEKHDQSISDYRSSIEKKIVSKAKRRHKESVDHFKALPHLYNNQEPVYEAPNVNDDYGLPDGLLKKKPSEWSNEERDLLLGR